VWSKGSYILASFVVIAGNFCLAACPSADLTGDCFVDFNDFALMAADWPATDFNNVTVMANQWLTTGSEAPDDMVLVPGGTFEMGDNLGDGHSDELPVHTVTVDSFYMGKCEITNEQFCNYLNSAMSQGSITVTSGDVHQPGSGTTYCDTLSADTDSQIDYSGDVFTVRTKSGRDMSNDPMVQVNWYGAAAYCNWRSRQEGKEQCYDLATWDCDFSKKGYRLPTEAEWKYAARGALSGSRFPWGDTISHNHANYNARPLSYTYDVNPTAGHHPTWNDGVEPYTSPTGSFAANGYGLHDMVGNVWEWCNDRYDDDYYDYSPTNNPTGPISGFYRAICGSDWNGTAYNCRIANRNNHWPNNRYNYCGFRIVLPE